MTTPRDGVPFLVGRGPNVYWDHDKDRFVVRGDADFVDPGPQPAVQAATLARYPTAEYVVRSGVWTLQLGVPVRMPQARAPSAVPVTPSPAPRPAVPPALPAPAPARAPAIPPLAPPPAASPPPAAMPPPAPVAPPPARQAPSPSPSPSPAPSQPSPAPAPAERPSPVATALAEPLAPPRPPPADFDYYVRPRRPAPPAAPPAPPVPRAPVRRRRTKRFVVARAAARGVVARRGRFAATLLAIVLGVAFVAGTAVLTDTLSGVIDHVFVGAASGVDVTVRSTSGLGANAGLRTDRARVPSALLATIQQVPGVAVADGIDIGSATVIAPNGQTVRPRAGPGIGLSWPADARVRPQRLKAGRAPARMGEVVLDESTAQDAHVSIGDRVRIASTGIALPFRVVGIMTFGDARSAGATLSSFDPRTAQLIFGAVGQYDAINVVAKSGVDPGALRRRIAAVLPSYAEAVDATAAARQDAQGLKDDLAIFEALVLVFAGVGLFVGAFIIFNTFGVVVAGRVREFGLLRAIGAEPKQLRRLVLVEAGLLGTVGGALGLGAGVGLAALAMRSVGALGIGVPAGPVRVHATRIVVAIAIGIVVTVVAALVPALRAARVTPVEALADAPPVASTRGRRTTVVGVALLAIACALIARALVDGVAYRLLWLGAGIVLLYVAIVCLMPFVARAVIRTIGAPLPRVAGAAGRLARENAQRNPRRSATTASTLMVGVSLMALTAILATSARASIGAAINDGLHAPIVLTGPELFPFTTGARDVIARAPEVAAAASVRLGNAQVNGRAARVAAIDPAEFAAAADLDVVDGSLAGLGPAGVLVQEGTARAHHWKVGDTVAVRLTRAATTDARIAGIFRRNQLVLANYVVSLATFEGSGAAQLDTFVYVLPRAGVSVAAARAAVERGLVQFPTVQVLDRHGYEQLLDNQIQRALGVVWALLALAVLIGLLGIVNTLALSVYERTRELGLLRSVGMGRGQVRTMVGAEAVVLALAGALLGVVLGLLTAWALTRVLADQGVDVFAVPYLALAAFCGLSAVAGVLASVLPAWRASRLDVLAAIHHE